MKKTGLLAVAVSLMLSLGAYAGEKAADAKARPQAEGKGKIRDRARSDEAQSPKALASQIAQLKQEHQVAINELQEIRKVAKEEKATKTLGAVDKLIARRNQELRKRLEPLQKRLDAAGRPKPDQPKGTTAAPKEGSPK